MAALLSPPPALAYDQLGLSAGAEDWSAEARLIREPETHAGVRLRGAEKRVPARPGLSIDASRGSRVRSERLVGHAQSLRSSPTAGSGLRGPARVGVRSD